MHTKTRRIIGLLVINSTLRCRQVRNLPSGDPWFLTC